MAYGPIVVVLAFFFVFPKISAYGQSFDFLEGTYEVKFQPMRVGGQLRACSLLFKTVTLDNAYKRGAPVALVGNVAVYAQPDQKNMVVSLKLGLSDALVQSGKVEPPFFAYLQTPNGTTAGSVFTSQDEDGGYRIFVYQLNESTGKVVTDIVLKKPLTVGFNRSKEGLDVLSVVDLTVVNSSFVGNEIKRTRSGKMLEEFTRCFSEIASYLK